MDHKFYLQIYHACLSIVSVHQMAPPLTEIGDIQLQLTAKRVDGTAYFFASAPSWTRMDTNFRQYKRESKQETSRPVKN